MTDWSRDWNPSEEYLTDGVPSGVVAEVERPATELAALGPESVRVGRPTDREGGLREFDFLGDRGFIDFPPAPRHERVYVCYVCDITWYG
ncbi:MULTISPECIES: hypothetical protein [Streptomyces]|uniref:Uncharacterized protein n=1 Tax=Streptomyces venezuelae TaxID=54571 RepID=A0A5P2B980_STRVZ|nr:MULTISPECIES: hypothetical protein [Streptomyces]NDZ99852.1 hypothetical protein [Streptomyces sp. SID10116]MYY86397.1 hypothetical protein [Streptomyces sp. SID335]MYZ14528.1 hypothetical protein [Streptomyces sp. SID337]NDZ88277.1 hypothetical protein [Streptomyces sp. SID10115]NEB44883.1 hypothetical protein [Streptomyces sp. SID339]